MSRGGGATAARARPRPAGVVAAREPRPWRDLAFIVAGWIVFAASIARGRLVTAYDAFRDMAYAHGILRGELGMDPTIPGLTAWYPAGNPLLFAALSRVTGAPVPVVYGTSLYWFGWLLPVAVYLVARAAFGRAVAWWSIPMVGLGSFWWITHAAMPMPSVQGVALGLLALWLWLHALDRSWPWALAAGCAVAFTAFFHPLSGALAGASIFFHGALAPLAASGEVGDRAAALRGLRRALIASGSAAALAVPILAPVLSGPVLNDAPRHWFGPELHDARFALQAHAPLVPILGLVGLVLAARRWRAGGWLVGYAAVALVAMLAGYAAHDLGWRLPYLIPHEFQWHLQLAGCVAAALATVAGGGWLARLLRRAGAAKLATAAVGALALGPALGQVGHTSEYVLRLDDGWRGPLELARWIRERRLGAGIIAGEPEICYYLSGLSGTRAQLLPDGHTNPRIAIAPRAEILSRMLQTRSESEFGSTLARLPADYVLQIPRDTSQLRDFQHRYDGWTMLERIALPESTLFLFRVRAGFARPPARLP